MAESFAIVSFTDWGDLLDLQCFIKEYTVADDKVGVIFTSHLWGLPLTSSVTRVFLLLI